MSASLVLAAMSLGGSLPIFAMGTAHAIGSATVVQPYSLQGWNSSTTGSGQVQFIQDKTAPSGKNAALQLTTAGNNEDRASLYLPTHTPLKSVSQLSYETRQISASFAGGDPAYRLTIDADGNPSTANDTATLVYEPYWQDPAHAGDPAPVVAGQWQSWDVASGVFWASIPGGNSVPGLDNGAGGPPFYTLSQLQSTLPNAEITEVSVGVGSYNLNYNTEVSDLNFDGNSYDFTTPPTPAQSSQVVYPSDLQLPFSSPDVWYYYDDNATSPFTAPTTTGSPSYFDIVANPVPQNGDNGAVVLNASNGGRPAIATTRYSGTKLSDISSMGFSTYQPSSNQGPANESSFLNFDVNFGTGLSGYQGRLVYVPSTNGTVKQNQWQNWETVASNGRWTWSHYYSNGSKWPDGSTSQYRSWDDIIAAFPNAQISGGYIPVGPSGINVPGQLLVRAGNPDNYTFVGYTDHIYLSTYQNDSNVNYNFELPAPATPTGLHFTQKGQTLANNVTNDGADNLQLRWSPVPNATGYALAWTAPDGKNSGGANPLRSVDLSNPYFSIVNTALHSSLLSHGNGVYTFEIYAIDNGVRSTTPATISLIYDTQAPTVAFTSPSGSYLNTTKPFTISGTYTEHGVSGISRIQLYISKGDKYSYGTHLGYWTATLLTKPIPPADDATGTFSYSVTQAEVNEFSSKLGIANGDKFTITAVPIDNAGNGQNSRFNLTLTADSTQPAITVTKPTSNSNPSITVYASNRWAPLQISGTATNIPANMMVKVTDIQNHGNTTEYLNDQVYTDKNGNWSVSVPAGKLTNGDLMQVIVFGRDRYGATATAYAYFTVDDTPPIVQLLAGTPADKS
ncbi:MAG TPA: hypothetical protein VF261_00890, partial [Candidatus Saccharimonadales bacterium]